ncbi:protein kinase domain-containing protein [Micromonospora sp. BQ11]|uniref:protein kinase domain-containing protein n=1 Tax=Micromonospora sp. BQ11 TaxID=3452212 RepID=UPI003F8CE5E1
MDFEGLWVGSDSRPDHYRLLRHLGGGSQGQVWEAEEPVSDGSWARVAVKIGGRVDGHDARTRWTRYGGLLRSLHSVPGLVRVVDVFLGPAPHRPGQLADTDVPEGGTADAPAGPPDDEIAVRLRYVVMALVPGDTLADVVRRHADLPLRRRLQLLRPVAAALDAMHDERSPARPVIHGDVKPDNVLLPADGEAVLVDLGSARITDDDRPVGRTRHYAAPELHDRSAVTTPATDRFAFAATVAHVLLGQPPPLGPSGPDVTATRQLLTGTAKVPPAVIDAVHTVLLAPPEARPAPLLPWLDALIATAAAGDHAEPAGSPATTDAERVAGPATARRARSRRRAAWAATAIATVLVAIPVTVALAVHLLPGAAAPTAAETTVAPPSATTTTDGPQPTATATASASPTSGSQPTPTPAASASPPSSPATVGPGTTVGSRPGATRGAPSASAVVTPLTATIGCDPACETTARVLTLTGTVSGGVPAGHHLLMFTRDEGGRFYAGSRVEPAAGRWTGSVYVGNSSGVASTYRYTVCLYVIDATFDADLKAMGMEKLNLGLASIPTVGEAKQVACIPAIWRRPT